MRGIMKLASASYACFTFSPPLRALRRVACVAAHSVPALIDDVDAKRCKSSCKNVFRMERLAKTEA